MPAACEGCSFVVAASVHCGVAQRLDCLARFTVKVHETLYTHCAAISWKVLPEPGDLRAEVELPSAEALAEMNTLELDFMLSCRGHLDAGARLGTVAAPLKQNALSVVGGTGHPGSGYCAHLPRPPECRGETEFNTVALLKPKSPFRSVR